MSTLICRPFITLRNGRRLFAHEVGKTAFCFEVNEVKTAKRHVTTEEQLDRKSPLQDDTTSIH